jgi:hypothetical protein
MKGPVIGGNGKIIKGPVFKPFDNQAIALARINRR